MSLINNPLWQALIQHRDQIKSRRLSDLILADSKRLSSCEISLSGLRLNYSLNFVTQDTMSLLARLAESRDVIGWRSRMFRGDKINASENRAALHTALRQSSDKPVFVGGLNIMLEIRATQQRTASFVQSVREGKYLGATGKRIKYVVNIGIGGSDLGPRLAVGALSAFTSDIETHFVANADAFEITSLFKKLDPAETLFVVVSKTFKTQETLLNANTARSWIVERLGEDAVARHFVAVSTNLDAVISFGIPPDQIFPLWDWVGGRFSLWSAVGLSVALAIGNENYTNLLRGAEAMDNHFRDTSLISNLPVVLAMLGVWSRNFLEFPAHVILPYSKRLSDMPRYLQQLEMESNGKSVTRDGQPVDVATTPILFGEAGTVGQHGFHQWLHQGTYIVSADFIGVVQDDLNRPEHHLALLSNLVAQAGALAFGQTKAPHPYDIYAGNRPSTIIMLDRLDPYNLGMLLALYEHKVFVQSVIWGINPFDQPGVELGKRMARSLAEGAPNNDVASSFVAKLYAKLTT